MDYHFLNTLKKDNSIYIIDWIDARNGKAILDYARTYVIIYEYAKGFKHKYLKEMLKRYNEDIFEKAIYVNAINRIKEHDSKRVRELLNAIENNKF